MLGREPPFLFGAQVALRFPGTLCVHDFEPLPIWKQLWHIDGLPSDENGIPEGSIRNFTLLVGVCLRDVLEDMCGNLVVFPRSHFSLEQYFKREGFANAKTGLKNLPAIALSNPVQVKLKKGDVVVAHYSLAHSIAPNTGYEIRTMVYFRVNMRTDNMFHPEPMLDIWLDFCQALRDMGRNLNDANCNSNDNDNNQGMLVKPGYVDAARAAEHKSLLESEERFQQLAARADELLAQHRFGECCDHFCQLSDQRPDDAILALKACMCLTASSTLNLAKGERRLREFVSKYPSLANGSVLLARNLLRQCDECRRPEVRVEALNLAEKGL